MNRVSKLFVIAAASITMTGTALAEDPPADPAAEGGAGAEVSGEASATVGADGATVGASVDASAGASYTKETWPTADIDRPQNALKGMLELRPEFQFVTTKIGESDRVNATQINIGGRYGISDKLELLFAFDRIILSPKPAEGGDRIKGQLALGAGFALTQGAAGGKLDTEAKAALLYDLAAETAVIAAGVDVRFKLSPKMWIGTPVNRPGLIVTVKGQEVGPDVTIAPIFLNIPFAFGFQATPALMIQANTDLIRLNLNEDAKAIAALQAGATELKSVTLIGADVTPLDVDIIFGLSNKMDVRLNVNLFDLNNAGDQIGLSAGVALRI